jgi:hypothetical protein
LNTDSLQVVTQKLVDILELNRNELGIAAVFYGDQTLIADYPSVCVDPVDVSRDLVGIGGNGQTENQFQCIIYVYHGPYRTVEQNRSEADSLCAAIEFILHSNVNLDGEVIHSYVARNESGRADRGGLLSANRLTWQGMSKTILGAVV